MKIFVTYLLIVLVSHNAAIDVSKSHVKFENNAYTNVLVALHDSIPEDATLIDKVKETFTGASKFLYNATRRRGYFNRVFIVLPSTWSGPYRTVSAATITDSDFVVSPPHQSHRNFPFTRSYGGCGQRGIHIQLNTDFLTKTSAPTIARKPDKFLVHEWASYRYGVFQEYPSPGENQFYFSTLEGRLDPVRCSRGLRGYILKMHSNGTRQICNPVRDVDPNTGELPDGCIYYPYPSHNSGTMSVMDHQYIQEIHDFCDDTVDNTVTKIYGHNREPPNRHNRLCSHRSTWDIITHTPDFSHDINSAVYKSDSDLVPSFMIFKDHAWKRVAIVMDLPKSPEDPQHREVRQAVHHLITDGLSAETEVVVVSTEGFDSKFNRLRNVRSVSSRHLVYPAFDKKYEQGGISMRHAVQQTIKTLSQDDSETIAKHLIVFNCGDDSQSDISDIIGERADVKHHVINCHPIIDRDHQIQNSEEEDHLHATNNQHGNTLVHAVHTLSHLLNKEKDRPVQLVNEVMVLQPFKEYPASFSLDGSLHGDLVVTVHFNTTLPRVTLISPKGNNYDVMSSENVEIDDVLKVMRIRFHDLVQEDKFGEWQYTLHNDGQDSNKISIVILASPHNNYDNLPITTNGWIKLYTDATPNRVGVYAEVSQGHHPIAGLVVKALISGDNNKTQEIQLLDNGAGADITKHDGIYSRFFTHASGSGSYHVIIKVSDPDMKGEIHITKQIDVKLWKKESGLTYQTIKKRLPHRITRSTSAGSIYLSQNITNTDSYPPSQIVDLQIEKLYGHNRTILLSWTAPGDDLDNGQAMMYDIRHSRSSLVLLDSVMEARVVTRDNLVTGNIDDPKIAGTKEYFMVQVPGRNRSIAIRIRAMDQNGNFGEFSNLATGAFYVSHSEYIVSVQDIEPENVPTMFATIFAVFFTLMGILVVFFLISKSTKRPDANIKGIQLP